MKQLILDFFSPPKMEKSKNNKGEKKAKEEVIIIDNMYIAPNGCRISIDGVIVKYDDGLEPYKMSFKSLEDAYENFMDWCKTELKASRKQKVKVAH